MIVALAGVDHFLPDAEIILPEGMIGVIAIMTVANGLVLLMTVTVSASANVNANVSVSVSGIGTIKMSVTDGIVTVRTMKTEKVRDNMVIGDMDMTDISRQKCP